MRRYFMDLLACPVCKASGPKLLLHVIEEEEAEPPTDVEQVRCRNYCSYLRRPASEVPLNTCMECSRKEVIVGVIVCLNCGRWYPIMEGIPIMLDDEYRDEKLYKKFISKYGEKIPASVREHMKIPDLRSLGLDLQE